MVVSKSGLRLQRVEDLLRPAIESRPADTLYMGLWGAIKSGKTAFISTGPAPVDFLTEPGHMTIRYSKTMTLFPVDKRGLWVPPRWHHALDFLNYLDHKPHKFGTAGVDSMSGLVNMAIHRILRDEESRDPERMPDTMTQPQWGRLAKMVLDYLEQLETVCKSKGMHLIITAHERKPGEEDVELEGSVVPDLTPKIRREVFKRPDIIARTFREGDDENEEELKYGMIFRDPEIMVGERVTPAGSKEPWLPRVGYDVTIPKLVQIIQRRISGSTQNSRKVIIKRKPGAR